MPKFDQRYQKVNTQFNVNLQIESKTHQTAPLDGLTYASILELCETQVKNEISIALGTKYIPSLYIDRQVLLQISNFIQKRPKDSLSYASNITTILYREIDAIRNRQTEIKEKELISRTRSLSKHDEKVLETLSNSIDEIYELMPLIKKLSDLLNAENLKMEELRSHIDLIEKHPACTDQIQVQINKLKQDLRNTIIIKDMAGRGKTNLMCALAQIQSKRQPTFLIMAGTLQLQNKYDLERYIQKAFGIPDSITTTNFLEHLSNLAEEANTDILFIIDAINENKDTDLLKAAIHSLISRYSDKHFKFMFTCRDIYWEGFLYRKGEFWEEYLFSQITLGDFTDEEFAKVLPLYLRHFRIVADLSPTAIEKLKHPLLLRFFCEAYHNAEKKVSLGVVDNIRLKQLFDVYWGNKIDSIKSNLKLRSNRDIESFLFLIARKMRFKRDRVLTIEEITRITDITDYDSKDSIFTAILDEGIILEQTPSGSDQWHKPRVTFVYDEFMEYVMARDILNNSILSADSASMKIKINRLAKSAKRFSSIYGVMAYLLPMLEFHGKFECWEFLLSRGSAWHESLSNAIYRVLPTELSTESLKVGMNIAINGNEAVRRRVLQIATEVEVAFPEDSILLWVALFMDHLIDIRLQSRDALVRLFFNGHKQALYALELALESPRPEIKGTALYALTELGECNIKKVLPLLHDEDGYVREAAIYLFGSLYNQVDEYTLEDVLKNRLSDSAPQVRVTAIQTIVDIGNPNLLPLLQHSKAWEATTFVRKEIDIAINMLEKKRGVHKIY